MALHHIALPEIVLNCLSFLGPRNLYPCMTVCKEWNELINDQQDLWKSLTNQYLNFVKFNTKRIILQLFKFQVYRIKTLDKIIEQFKGGDLIDGEQLKGLKLDENPAKNEFMILVGRIYAQIWIAYNVIASSFKEGDLDIKRCAKKINNFKFYEVLRLLRVPQRFNYSKCLEIFRPLFSFEEFCKEASDTREKVHPADKLEPHKLEQILQWEKTMGAYVKDGNNITLPEEDLFENGLFEKLVLKLFGDLTRFGIVKNMLGNKWPSKDNETNSLFYAFLFTLKERVHENKVLPSEMISKIDKMIEILRIEKCDHECMLLLIQGRWFGQVVNLFNKYKYLINENQAKRVFQSLHTATDYPELMKYLVSEYNINPLEFHDERNIIAQYFESLIENNDISLGYIMDPILVYAGVEKLDVEEFCSKCKENNYPNLSSVDQIFNIMECVVMKCPSYAFTGLISRLNTLFEPKICFKHTTIFSRLLEFYNEEKTQLSCYEELLNNTQVISEYTGIKYHSMKELLTQEGDHNQLFGEVLEGCEKFFRQKRSELQ